MSSRRLYLQRPAWEGFTLVEVMVALAVVAVALPSLLFLLSQQLDGASYLSEKSMASWVAADRLAELRLVVSRQKSLPEGVLTGETEMQDRRWYWWIEQEATEVPGFVRLEISVSGSDDPEAAPLHQLVAFVAPEKWSDAQQ